ncbi:MAG: thiamine biosynthesis protein ThiF [Bacteroidetes bacterium GWE2_42_24]|nr:MAG: thiamine biosynthesis protein ThiF [Bacteroidetes bacterium GWE2_42_24]
MITVIQQIADYLRNFSVGIAGAGGLGSNCAIALARTGVGNIYIADFDIVEASNLNRQYFFLNQIGLPKVEALAQNLHQVNASINVVSFNERLTTDNIPEFFAQCNIIIEAFDKADQKQMLAECVLQKIPDATLIMGTGLAGYKTTPFQTSRFNKLIVCGDMENEVDELNPPMAPRVGIVAMMQANEALNILLKDFTLKK